MVGEWAEGGMTKGRWVYKDGSMFHGTFDKLQPVSRTGALPDAAVCSVVLKTERKGGVRREQLQWVV